MKQINELRIFLASPGDVEVERTIVQEVLAELNITHGTKNDYNLKLINWEDYTFPALGEDAQDVVNSQIPFDYDVFICVIFWTRIEHKQKRAKSGTIEELEIAKAKWPERESDGNYGYFKTEPPSSLNDLDEQYFEVRALQKDFSSIGLYKEFTSTNKFKDIFRINFTHYLNSKFLINDNKQIQLPSKLNTIEIENKKRNEIYSKLNSLNLDSKNDFELYDTMEIINDKSSQLTIVMEDISNTMNDLSTKVNRKTDEINKINKIKDTKLRLHKHKISVNQLANELDVISDKYEFYISEFKENYLELINSFIFYYLSYQLYMSEEEKLVKHILIDKR
ncbi:MAG: hypothetical protein IPO94_10640 [Saprospiraceae bacterium]|nr:hypothetical protein [Saprospiraceae bacterium]